MSEDTRITPSPAVSGTVEDSLCGICFTEVSEVDNPRGIINSCRHLFCFYCISTWAKDTNVCPHCKARFSRITTFDPSTQTETTVKVRKKNFRGWEEDSEDDEEGDEGDANGASPTSATRRAAPVCAVCHASTNAARFIFCDRHSCAYVAHMDCLGILEAPQTFVCDGCSRPTSQSQMVEADARLARRLELEQRDEERGARLRTSEGSAAGSVSRPLQPVPQSTRVEMSPSAPPAAAAEVDDGTPYYLKGTNTAQAELAMQQLQSRLEASNYTRLVRQESKLRVSATQTPNQDAPATSQERITSGKKRSRSGAPNSLPQQQAAVPPPPPAETLDDMERRILRQTFGDQLAIVRRRHYIQQNQLKLVGDGHIAVAQPVSRLDEIHREENIRTEALRIAKRMTEERMASVRFAHKQQLQREAERKARREAYALGKLAEIVRLHRSRELAASRNAAEDVLHREVKAEPTLAVVKKEKNDDHRQQSSAHFLKKES